MVIENRNGTVYIQMTESSYKMFCQMVTEAYMLRAKKFYTVQTQRSKVPDDDYYLVEKTFEDGKFLYELFREIGPSVEALESPLLGYPDLAEPWQGDGLFLP